MIYALIILWFGYWSSEAGASFPWSKDWQDKADFLSEIPEIIIALSVGFISASFFSFLGWISGAIFIIGALIAYVGKQSATWPYLRWESHPDPNLNRGATLKPFNDWLAGLFGFKIGDEGYAWVWAATKGFIMTLPVGGTGLIFHPIGHEIGSHAKGRLKNPNMYKEFLAGAFGIGIPCAILWAIMG